MEVYPIDGDWQGFERFASQRVGAHRDDLTGTVYAA
jgi:hypothetical protein